MMTGNLTRMNLRGGLRPASRRSGFTLIEILVVVAIIALLVAILLPSLARAREAGRAAQCLSNTKQLGMATQTYTVDHKGSLPGPLHPMIMRGTFDDFYKSHDAEDESSASGIYRRQQLVYYLRKYLNEKGKSGQMFDTVSTCPTASGLMSSNIKQAIDQGLYTSYAGYRPFNYVINSVKVGATDTYPNSYGPPYIGTKPPFYFGVVYAGYTWDQWGTPRANGLSDFDTANGLTNPTYKKPKKIEIIKRPGDEWAYADAWYAEVQARSTTGSGTQIKPGGTWPYLQGLSSSLSPGGFIMIPTWAYHNTRHTYGMSMEVAKADTNAHSPRFTDGTTGAVHMDGHGAQIRVWKGTSNPCFPGDISCN